MAAIAPRILKTRNLATKSRSRDSAVSSTHPLMSKPKSSSDEKKRGPDKEAASKDESKPGDGGWRETVESIAMAVILALLFRGFVAEAFVIPTGSMAPTLRGRHKDVQCPECGLWFQTGASDEMSRDDSKPNASVVAGTCPSCRFTRPINVFERANDDSFNGDRIIVSKFIYDFAPPQRWDVIVFKFPGDATQNYIKRLIGLPNETVRVQGGNIWIRQGKEGEFQIARKPPDKLVALLQLVSDSDHISRSVLAAKWPLEWHEELPLGAANGQWTTEQTGPTSVAFWCDAMGEGVKWLRFRRIVPTKDEWTDHLLADPPTRPSQVAGASGELITDFYSYDTAQVRDLGVGGTLESIDQTPVNPPPRFERASPYGQDWVDDLAVECLADVQGNSGTLILDLVRAGVHHRCEINVTNGAAQLSRADLADNRVPFSDENKSFDAVKASTSVRGPGKYRLRLSNCDHQVLLWVNGHVVAFDGPTTYASEPLVMPVTTPRDRGDLQPARVGARNLAVRLSQLRIYRDKYYIAQKKSDDEQDQNEDFPFVPELDELLKSPDEWPGHLYFRQRGFVEFQLGPDQFFPMGDNSPASQDGRTWPDGIVKMSTPNYVRRDLLIGKAMFVYWPHTWNRPVPFTPNPTQMRPIR